MGTANIVLTNKARAIVELPYRDGPPPAKDAKDARPLHYLRLSPEESVSIDPAKLGALREIPAFGGMVGKGELTLSRPLEG